MKPKVLFFLHLPPPFHGVSLTNERIIHSQKIRQGFQINLLPISYNQDIATIGEFQLKKIVKYFWLLVILLKKLIFFRPDLIYFSIVPTGTPFYRDALFAFLAKIFCKKIIFHLHGVGIQNFIKGRLSLWIYRGVFRKAYVIIQSSLLSEDLNQMNDVIAKTFVVHNGIPLQNTSAPNKVANDITTFVNVSTIIPAKGQMDILKAIKILTDKNTGFFRVVFIGQVFDAHYEQQMKTYVQENRLEKYVLFKGPLFGESKEKAISDADVFLFPTYNESFGLVSIEAMQRGLPVIATHVGSLPEIVEEGAGFLYAPGDIKKLAGHMDFFLNNKKEITQMGQKAFEVFIRKFTFELFEQKMQNVFWDVLQSERPNIFPRPHD